MTKPRKRSGLCKEDYSLDLKRLLQGCLQVFQTALQKKHDAAYSNGCGPDLDKGELKHQFGIQTLVVSIHWARREKDEILNRRHASILTSYLTCTARPPSIFVLDLACKPNESHRSK